MNPVYTKLTPPSRRLIDTMLMDNMGKSRVASLAIAKAIADRLSLVESTATLVNVRDNLSLSAQYSKDMSLLYPHMSFRTADIELLVGKFYGIRMSVAYPKPRGYREGQWINPLVATLSADDITLLTSKTCYNLYVDIVRLLEEAS